MSRTSRWTFCLVMSLGFCTPSVGHALQGDVVAGSARQFVTGFYEWYVPQALKDRAEPAFNAALREKSANFDPQLLRLLRADSAAQAKCEDIVGIDFDPFLSSQDPAERYEIGEIMRNGSEYRAEIYSVQAGQRAIAPDLRAAFTKRNGRWVFVNFYYPDGGDLLKILQLSRETCTAKRPPGHFKRRSPSQPPDNRKATQ